MTRKHFEATAKILRANFDLGIMNIKVVFDFADYFEELNPLFDRKRFITASTGLFNAEPSNPKNYKPYKKEQ